jgi:hypothetical protein
MRIARRSTEDRQTSYNRIHNRYFGVAIYRKPLKTKDVSGIIAIIVTGKCASKCRYRWQSVRWRNSRPSKGFHNQ